VQTLIESLSDISFYLLSTCVNLKLLQSCAKDIPIRSLTDRKRVSLAIIHEEKSFDCKIYAENVPYYMQNIPKL